MKTMVVAGLLAAGLLGVTAGAPPPELDWAYPYVPAEKAVDAFPHRPVYAVPGSPLRLTEAQLSDPFDVVDWKPRTHGPAPAVVLHGRKPDLPGCGMCHGAGGRGGSDSPALAGLPRDYILRQLAEFAAGRRPSAHALRDGPKHMKLVAERVTPAEAEAAAAYFSSLTYKPWIRVVETTQSPRTRPAKHGWLNVVPDGGFEPLGRRVIMVAEDADRTAIDDPDSGFVAYAPRGSVARGGRLVRTGAGVTLACAACHGADLRGRGAAPPLAGRSAPYLARQLWDIRAGGRAGEAVAPMQPVVARLTPNDIVDITAYLASRRP